MDVELIDERVAILKALEGLRRGHQASLRTHKCPVDQAFVQGKCEGFDIAMNLIAERMIDQLTKSSDIAF